MAVSFRGMAASWRGMGASRLGAVTEKMPADHPYPDLLPIQNWRLWKFRQSRAAMTDTTKTFNVKNLQHRRRTHEA